MAKTRELLINISIGLGLAIVLYLILKFTGVFKSKTEKEAEQIEDDIDSRSDVVMQDFKFANVFNKSWISQQKNLKRSFTTAEKYIPYADKCYEALKGGIFTENEDLLYSVFISLPFLADIYAMSQAYNLKYKRNLLQDMFDMLSKTELAKVEQILKNRKSR